MSRHRHSSFRRKKRRALEWLKGLARKDPQPVVPPNRFPEVQTPLSVPRHSRPRHRKWFILERLKNLVRRKPQPVPMTDSPLGQKPVGDLKTSHLRRKKWFTVARLKHLLAVLPAVLALLFWPLMGAVALWSLLTVEQRYVFHADSALAAGKYEDARIACERLLQLTSKQRPFHVYRMAISLNGLGQTQASLELLAAIASVDSLEFNRIHRAVASAILRTPAVNTSALQVAGSHLKRALASGDDSAEVLEMLGQTHSRLGEWNQAREYFLRGYAFRKDLALPLAAVAEAQGDTQQAKRWASEAAHYFEEQTNRREGSETPRLGWAQAKMILKEHSPALAILEEGLKEKDLPSYHQLAAHAVAGLLQAITNKSPETIAARLGLIQKGLAHDPNNQALLQELIATTHLGGAQGEASRAILNRMLARGEFAASVHFCLGLDAWQNKDLNRSRQHFELVFKLYPKMSVVANNLAWLLTFSEPHDYDRALLIMDELLKRHPDSPNFRETRGEVLVRLGRWRDAVTDLEYALPWHKQNPGTHAALAQAYGKLGMKDLAAEHQRLAQPQSGDKPGAAPKPAGGRQR